VEEIDLLEGDPAHKEIGCALCMAWRLLRQSLFDGVSVLTRTLRSLMFKPCSSQHRPPPQFALLPSANAQSVRTYAFLDLPARLNSKLGNIIAKTPPPSLSLPSHTLSFPASPFTRFLSPSPPLSYSNTSAPARACMCGWFPTIKGA
jgi:hypothetical protein